MNDTSEAEKTLLELKAQMALKKFDYASESALVVLPVDVDERCEVGGFQLEVNKDIICKRYATHKWDVIHEKRVVVCTVCGKVKDTSMGFRSMASSAIAPVPDIFNPRAIIKSTGF